MGSHTRGWWRACRRRGARGVWGALSGSGIGVPGSWSGVVHSRLASDDGVDGRSSWPAAGAWSVAVRGGGCGMAGGRGGGRVAAGRVRGWCLGFLVACGGRVVVFRCGRQMRNRRLAGWSRTSCRRAGVRGTGPVRGWCLGFLVRRGVCRPWRWGRSRWGSASPAAGGWWCAGAGEGVDRRRAGWWRVCCGRAGVRAGWVGRARGGVLGSWSGVVVQAALPLRTESTCGPPCLRNARAVRTTAASRRGRSGRPRRCRAWARRSTSRTFAAPAAGPTPPPSRRGPGSPPPAGSAGPPSP